MAKTHILTQVADFDVGGTGYTFNAADFHATTPSIVSTSVTSGLIDVTRWTNEAFALSLKTANVTSSHVRIILGSTAAGVGHAIDFVFGAEVVCNFVTITSATDASPVIISTRNINIMSKWVNDTWYKVEIAIQGDKLIVKFNGYNTFSESNITWSGTHFGVASLTTTSTSISDIFHYTDQVIYGNVNLNGVNDARGIVNLYNQNTHELIARVNCNVNGEWMIFIEDDPVFQNRYMLYGYVDGIGIAQPRGVTNILL